MHMVLAKLRKHGHTSLQVHVVLAKLLTQRHASVQVYVVLAKLQNINTQARKSLVKTSFVRFHIRFPCHYFKTCLFLCSFSSDA